MYFHCTENNYAIPFGYECHSLVLPHGEPTKSFDTLPKVYSAMLTQNWPEAILWSLGGGGSGIWPGFAASTYGEWIKRAQIPTSLLAQVDYPSAGNRQTFPQGKSCRRSSIRNGADRSSCTEHTAWSFHLWRHTVDQIWLHQRPGCLIFLYSFIWRFKPDLPKITFRCVDIKRIVMVKQTSLIMESGCFLNFYYTLTIRLNNIINMSGAMEKPSESACISLRKCQKNAALPQRDALKRFGKL